MTVASALLAPLAASSAAGARTGPTIVPWAQSRTLHLRAIAVANPLATPEGPGYVALDTASSTTAATASRGAQGTGPADMAGAASKASPTAVAGSGEGVIALTMSAAGTSWASRRNTAAMAEVSVDGGPPQTIELFYGGREFTYEGFLGPLTAGRHTVTITDSTLSDAHDSPAIRVRAAQLGVIPKSDPDYWAVAYAPFIYGRSSSPHGYIPLLTYVDQSAAAGGLHTLSYTYIISAHDQGDSLVPAYQWGTWGRMTDIVSIITEQVAADGTVTSAQYSSCACEGTPYPDSVMSPTDSAEASFAGSWLGHHPMLRDATATNYLSDEGTTAYRFQQAPVAGPAPGQVREAVMDAHPWTYFVSNQELPREHLISTSPDNILVGDYRQYAVVDSDISTSGSDSVQFELQLKGDPTWYSTDYEQMTGGEPSTFAFHDGGHNRTVIKLPLDWGQKPITAFRIRLTVTPGNPPATATVNSLELLEVTDSWKVIERALPPITVYQAPALDPTTLPV